MREKKRWSFDAFFNEYKEHPKCLCLKMFEHMEKIIFVSPEASVGVVFSEETYTHAHTYTVVSALTVCNGLPEIAIIDEE